MRPFIHTDTAAAMLNAMLSMSSAMLRLYRAQDTAKRHDREKVMVPGPSGLVLGAMAPAARRIEAALPRALEADVVSAMSDIRARTQECDDKLRAMKADPEWSEQQSRHEHYYGLTALGALFMVGYRFAEDEAAALEVFADPSKSAALFSIDPRPLPRELDRKHVARALHMLAAYRELLGQGLGGYDSLTVWDAHPVRDHAAEVITHMATAKELSPALCRARSMFDLSHHHRSGSARLAERHG